MRSIERLKVFVEREKVTVFQLFNPFFMIPLLNRYRYTHFFLTGMTGVAFNLLITWIFAEFVFGRERYFFGYALGLASNLVYNFTLHTVMTFKTKERHLRRFAVFIVYSLLMTVFQAWLVKVITPVIGIDYYLLVIAVVILLFSTVSFVVFKLSMFNENK